MMQKLTHYDTRRLIPVSSGKGTGDGLRLAWQAGAQQYGTGMAMLFGGYLKDPSEPSFKYMASQMETAAGQQPLLWLNEHGERFVDEAVVYNFSYAGNALYTQNQVFSILDQGVINKMAQDGNFMGLGVYVRRGEKMTKLRLKSMQPWPPINHLFLKPIRLKRWRPKCTYLLIKSPTPFKLTTNIVIMVKTMISARILNISLKFRKVHFTALNSMLVPFVPWVVSK